jgi:hypothetical protein
MDSNGRPVVSNILATDIRTDINRATTICSCDSAGIFYKEVPFTTMEEIGTNEAGTVKFVNIKPDIDHFDLVLYPFKSYRQIGSTNRKANTVLDAYDGSFSYMGDVVTSDLTHISDLLDASSVKTVAHNITYPRAGQRGKGNGDIVSINNYLKLDAIISTNVKVTTEEGKILKENIKIALANAFNMRELDFGEEIPFDSILSVMENADQ